MQMYWLAFIEKYKLRKSLADHNDMHHLKANSTAKELNITLVELILMENYVG